MTFGNLLDQLKQLPDVEVRFYSMPGKKEQHTTIYFCGELVHWTDVDTVGRVTFWDHEIMPDLIAEAEKLLPCPKGWDIVES